MAKTIIGVILLKRLWWDGDKCMVSSEVLFIFKSNIPATTTIICFQFYSEKYKNLKRNLCTDMLSTFIISASYSHWTNLEYYELLHN